MKKLDISGLVTLNNNVFEAMEQKQYESIGAAIYSELHKMCQYWADKVKHTEHDPFKDDKNIFKCISHISTSEAMGYYLLHMNHCFGEKYHGAQSVIPKMPPFIL